MSELRDCSSLSFVNDDDELRLWSVAASGAWGTDCETGRAYGDEIVQYMRAKDDVSILPQVVSAMATATGGKFSGIEVGFLTMIGISCQLGA